MANIKLVRFVAEVFRAQVGVPPHEHRLDEPDHEHEPFSSGIDYDYIVWAQHEKEALKIAKRRVAAVHGEGSTIVIRGRIST